MSTKEAKKQKAESYSPSELEAQYSSVIESSIDDHHALKIMKPLKLLLQKNIVSKCLDKEKEQKHSFIWERTLTRATWMKLESTKARFFTLFVRTIWVCIH